MYAFLLTHFWIYNLPAYLPISYFTSKLGESHVKRWGVTFYLYENWKNGILISACKTLVQTVVVPDAAKIPATAKLECYCIKDIIKLGV